MTRKSEAKTSQQTLELRKILNNKKLDTEGRLRSYAETQHSKILKKSLRK